MDTMDMGELGDMGGMDTGSQGLFTAGNQAIARTYWFIIAGFIGALTVTRIATWTQSKRRRAQYQKYNGSVASRPHGILSQAGATATAVFRELVYPQVIWFKYFSPPPLGRCLLLAIYWLVILILLWSNVILQSDSPMYGYKWEIVGFRAAWVSVTQIPFIYLLSCKSNPISLLTGISYERFNWLHRWAARTVFMTVMVHWSFFLREWWLSDFVELEFSMMPMVKYGFGAWSVIGWMVFSGFGFFRATNYELFVVQHICAAATLLWLLYVHVPAYATYNVWMSIAFVAFDWGTRLIMGFIRNTHLLGKLGLQAPGYTASLEPLAGDMTMLTVEDVDFSWSAGQHVYLCIPGLRPFEAHPFTIANAPCGLDRTARSLTLMIKAHSGFSRTLYEAALKDVRADRRRRVFLTGLFGMPPDLLHFENVVLIACSSGASFIMPLLQDLVNKKGCVQTVALYWIIRSQDHFDWFRQTVAEILEAARLGRVELRVCVHVTKGSDPDDATRPTADLLKADNEVVVDVDLASDRSTGSLPSSKYEKNPTFTALPYGRPIERDSDRIAVRRGARPSVESMIRPSVEAAAGETAVVTCGGLAITAQTRTFVASLSDERAVHKGSGAQGIYLFTETYGW